MFLPFSRVTGKDGQRYLGMNHKGCNPIAEDSQTVLRFPGNENGTAGRRRYARRPLTPSPTDPVSVAAAIVATPPTGLMFHGGRR